MKTKKRIKRNIYTIEFSERLKCFTLAQNGIKGYIDTAYGSDALERLKSKAEQLAKLNAPSELRLIEKNIRFDK